MPDISLVSSGTTGGITALLLIAIKEFGMRWIGRSRGYTTRKDVEKAIVDHEEKERFASLVGEERVKEINTALSKKIDGTDLRVKIFEHQEKCIANLRADMKENQAAMLNSLSQFQAQTMTLFNQFQENNRQSITRIHGRLDRIADKVGAGE